MVDFINMRKVDNKKALYQKMKDVMQSDRAKHTILPLTKFGLLQITRQRVRPELTIATTEICPTCGGTGKIAPSLLVTDQIEHHLEYLLVKQNEKDLTISMHPFVHAFFTKGIYSRQMQWYMKYHKWVKLEIDSSLGLVDYHFHNTSGEEIELTNGEKEKEQEKVEV